MHVTGYTLILMIEMNISYYYGADVWQTACLNINAGLEGDLNKGADYTEVSVAVNNMSDDIVAPDINKSQLKFVSKDGKVLYGLKAIAGLDTNTLEAVLEHRPFSSLEDFYTRMVDTKLTSPKKTITLIKSGAMDNLEDKKRKLIMADLVKLVIPQKDKITMTQLSYVRDIIPSEFNHLLNLYDFRNRIEGRNKEKMNEEIEKTFIQNYSKEVEYEFTNGELSIDMKSWKKYYNKAISPLKEEIKKNKYAKEFTKKKRQEYWLEECSGTIPEWEIETILFNTDTFVIDTEQVHERHEISEFNELPNAPLKGVNKRGFLEYEISAITGVVTGYNHQKKLVYLLTKESGVIILKMNKKSYAKYHEKLENDGSWFERGTKLVCIGYKNGESFQLRGNNIYRKPLIKVNGSKNYTYQNEKSIDRD